MPPQPTPPQRDNTNLRVSVTCPPDPSQSFTRRRAEPYQEKDPPVKAGQRYTDVRPLPLAKIFTGRAGRPDTLGGREEEEAKIVNWEERSGSGAEVYEEEDEEGGSQEFPEEEAWQETPSAGSGQLDHIFESISALAFSAALLQVQAD